MEGEEVYQSDSVNRQPFHLILTGLFPVIKERFSEK